MTRDWTIAARLVGANVRRHRLAKGLTQQQLAAKVRLSCSAVQLVERGSANMTLRLQLAIASGLDMSLVELFAQTDPLERRVGRPPRRRQVQRS